MRHVKNPQAELEALEKQSAAPFAEAMTRLIRAILKGKSTTPAQNGLRKLFAEVMTLSDLIGRRRLLMEADAAESEGIPSDLPAVLFSEPQALPEVTFLQAIKDLTEREPRLADASDGTPLWRQVANMYQQGPAFALARSTDVTLTRKIQKKLEGFLRRGVQPANAEKIIAEMGGFTQAYAETVYRTNLANAYTAGRFRQAQSDDVARVIGAFEYHTAGDDDVRGNHAAANGLIASQFDPIWQTAAPPNGYNCRCGLRLVGKAELKRKGLVNASGDVQRREPARFAQFRPDPGFEVFRRPGDNISS